MSNTSHDEQHELVLLTESPYDTPDPHKALEDPEGLSAVGGDLSTDRLLHLYSKGFFPWFSDPDPILWWHPGERCTLVPSDFHASKSLKKALRNGNWSFSVNQDFETVIDHCAALRADKEGTWISNDIKQAYTQLHRLGYAHSIEIWQNTALVGGFYGVAMGNLFFGESMFSLQPNASKVALKVFCDLAQTCQIQLIDCQVESDHLLSLGAKNLSRAQFCDALDRLIPEPTKNYMLIEIGEKQQKQPI
ncbi:leucyl/phenylalanyl-tRNA--protein transferase [Marinomonas sp. A79]|uniref:Leucyl/phenylalanyl-tRNA--protein transferase n=1 Tax=Marinomonas vulgaris TaxID=2823372 RepID=A0ABS5HAC9_9GAMM|nr:leucyl/phenylalanyl-tRNA--protein transferase [Marinomonas vulgaris]MBR7888334.1 leucyl/phenylalanyl-tRNA--protein transferase [Marinomonas vulgaris]